MDDGMEKWMKAPEGADDMDDDYYKDPDFDHFFRRKPLEVGSFDDYNFVLPDKRLFDVAEILVIRLSHSYVVIKNIGMRGDDKVYRIVNGEKVDLDKLDFIDVTINDLDLGRAVKPEYTGKFLCFDARPRERMLFNHVLV